MVDSTVFFFTDKKIIRSKQIINKKNRLIWMKKYFCVILLTPAAMFDVSFVFWFLLHVSPTSLILETYDGDFISRVRVRFRYKNYLHNISELIREGGACFFHSVKCFSKFLCNGVYFQVLVFGDLFCDYYFYYLFIYYYFFAIFNLQFK